MFCTKCGKQVSEGAAFCTHCGSQVQAATGTIQAAAQSSPQAGALHNA